MEPPYAAPGNPGIAADAERAAVDPADHRGVIDFCLRHSIGLVVIGPEAPLVDGLADNIRTMGIAVFGPGRDAARLEGSKGFTKELCAREGIRSEEHTSELQSLMRNSYAVFCLKKKNITNT